MFADDLLTLTACSFQNEKPVHICQRRSLGKRFCLENVIHHIHWFVCQLIKFSSQKSNVKSSGGGFCFEFLPLGWEFIAIIKKHNRADIEGPLQQKLLQGHVCPVEKYFQFRTQLLGMSSGVRCVRCVGRPLSCFTIVLSFET